MDLEVRMALTVRESNSAGEWVREDSGNVLFLAGYMDVNSF